MERIKSEDDSLLYGEQLPDEFQSLRVASISGIPDKDRKVAYVNIAFGFGEHCYGLFIGPPGFRPTETFQYLNQWDDQTWYYDDLPVRRSPK
jgi:hypothetical protein